MHAGVLTDDDIVEAARGGRLIVENFCAANVRQACYELRAGDVYHDVSGDCQRIALEPPFRFILLKPHQLVVVITKERLAIPADVVGRVFMKGKLFSLGLQPVSTYADPGFDGRMGIVIYNTSPNYIRIDEGDAIAKIEFERLPKPVARPYSGQHGYSAGIWPVPEYMKLRYKDVRDDPRVGTPGEEYRLSFGEEFGAVVDRVFRYERVLLLSTLAYVGLAVVIIVYSEARGSQLSLLAAFLLGLITNLVSGFLTYAATVIRGRVQT